MTGVEVTGEAVAVDRALTDFAAEVGTTGPVAAEGGRTRWELGGTPAAGTRLVRAPGGILEHRPEEMTVRVRAGTTVADLHAEIGTRGQRTALPERGGTVGGALVVGENDLAVRGRGRVRDALLQVRYVSADGIVVTGGAPTVKNVSGFDLPRLLVGSLGTLGLLAEVVLRTNPVPPASCWLVSPDADPFAASDCAPGAAAVLWDGSCTWLQLEGHPADVADQRGALGTLGTWEEVGGPPTLPPWRWSLAPAELHHLDHQETGGFVASVGVGAVFAHQPPPAADLSPTVARLTERVKAQFDPTGRLNPGRAPARRGR